MNQPLLRMRHVGRRMSEGFVVYVKALDLWPGEVLAILGPSGCGKSTVLDLIGALLKPDHAEEFLFQPDGNTLWNLKALWEQGDRSGLTRMRGRHIGYVLQTGGLLPFLSVRDNIAATATIARRPLRRDAIGGLLDDLELRPFETRRPGQLSIGQRQRVAIARALAHDPQLILADEPTASLDPRLKAQALLQLIQNVRKRNGSAIIVSHDVELINRSGIKNIASFESNHENNTEYSDISRAL